MKRARALLLLALMSLGIALPVHAQRPTRTRVIHVYPAHPPPPPPRPHPNEVRPPTPRIEPPKWVHIDPQGRVIASHPEVEKKFRERLNLNTKSSLVPVDRPKALREAAAGEASLFHEVEEARQLEPTPSMEAERREPLLKLVREGHPPTVVMRNRDDALSYGLGHPADLVLVKRSESPMDSVRKLEAPVSELHLFDSSTPERARGSIEPLVAKGGRSVQEILAENLEHAPEGALFVVKTHVTDGHMVFADGSRMLLGPALATEKLIVLGCATSTEAPRGPFPLIVTHKSLTETEARRMLESIKNAIIEQRAAGKTPTLFDVYLRLKQDLPGGPQVFGVTVERETERFEGGPG